MNQSINVLAAMLSDYANTLKKEGHTVAAQLVTQRANQAIADLNSSDAEVPEEDRAPVTDQ